MKLTSFFLISLVILSLIVSIGCGKKEEHKTTEITKDETGGEDQFMETIKPKPINYDSMLIVISQLTDSIKNNMIDFELRQKLVSISYDTAWETILAAGIGKPFQDAETESIALKYAEQAATADAYRWAVYIKKWYIDPTFPEEGSLDIEIQGGRVVAKKGLPDQRVKVLIEIHSSKIP